MKGGQQQHGHHLTSEITAAAEEKPATFSRDASNIQHGRQQHSAGTPATAAGTHNYTVEHREQSRWQQQKQKIPDVNNRRETCKSRDASSSRYANNSTVDCDCLNVSILGCSVLLLCRRLTCCFVLNVLIRAISVRPVFVLMDCDCLHVLLCFCFIVLLPVLFLPLLFACQRSYEL
jgi:hypothetical protein